MPFILMIWCVVYFGLLLVALGLEIYILLDNYGVLFWVSNILDKWKYAKKNKNNG